MEEKVENQDALDEAISADAYINQTDDQAVLAAQRAFGITTLFPWQRIVIANILDAASPHPGEEIEDNELNDVVCTGKQIVLLPTGAGKSLCFLTPALLLDGPTLVIYPLLALMSDQKRRMDSGNMVSVEFRGGQSAEERENNFRLISEGAKIILANPEVLQNEALVERLSKCGIRHIAIDEAHCVSEWGDSFRPAYLTLGKIISKINAPAVTAFTATASPQVLERVSEVLFGGNVHIIRSDCDRPNIHFHVVNAFDKKREAFKLAITQEKPLLIFCGTRAKSEDMARELTTYYGKEKVRYYHAGLERDEKTDIEKWFYERDDAILCCTCAYGMGVDKK
ncbi:MAG: ATP-dependent DNA helicase RecQ, partial [Treponema sp.]|nr:ATP-dependent DNA helicase RecQ [Treponema sp.]